MDKADAHRTVVSKRRKGQRQSILRSASRDRTERIRGKIMEIPKRTPCTDTKADASKVCPQGPKKEPALSRAMHACTTCQGYLGLIKKDQINSQATHAQIVNGLCMPTQRHLVGQSIAQADALRRCIGIGCGLPAKILPPVPDRNSKIDHACGQ